MLHMTGTTEQSESVGAEIRLKEKMGVWGLSLENFLNHTPFRSMELAMEAITSFSSNICR